MSLRSRTISVQFQECSLVSRRIIHRDMGLPIAVQNIALVHSLLGGFQVDFRRRGFGGVLFWE